MAAFGFALVVSVRWVLALSLAVSRRSILILVLLSLLVLRKLKEERLR